MRKTVEIILIFHLLTASIAWSEYPEIRSLKASDIVFLQLQKDIESYYKAQGRMDPDSLPGLAFFSYKVCKGDTLFSVAARLNISYDTISSLNRISQASEFASRTEIIVPNMSGIFVPLEPESALEDIMYAWRSSDSVQTPVITVKRDGKSAQCLFFRGDKFHTVERAYFLRILFRFPLDRVVLTSRFGARSDPFSGNPAFHNGIDLAGPVGTAVFSTREGTVSECGYNDSYGNYVRISHPGGYETLYGHLADYSVSRSEAVKAGARIGSIGMTGKTTGPHLHFEIIKDGKRLDPNSLLPEKQ